MKTLELKFRNYALLFDEGFTLSLGFGTRRETRKEPLKCPTDGGSGPRSRMRVIVMQQKGSIAEAG